MRLALVFALLNALGSPMAWAHWLGGGVAAQAASASVSPSVADMSAMAPGCHGHESAASEHSTRPGSMACCDGNGCVCAAAALVILVHTPSAATQNLPLDTPADTSALPAHPLDDSLRPPIA